MYKLILVDDESEICQGLKEIVPFESLGFQVVGEAGNGVEALALCESLEPDLIITDIRMPLMDGLTLCRRVRASLPTAQFIILSGYDDFEYARQAIEVKTMGYLLKPISSAEFVAMLKNAKASLDEEFAKRRNVSRLTEHFRESLPLLREMLLSSLLSGGMDPASALASAQKYGVGLQAPAYVVALLRMGENETPDGIQDDQLRVFAVRNILCEALEGRAQGYSFLAFMYNGMPALLLLLSSQEEALFAEAVLHLEEARKTIRHYLACPLFVGVSGTADRLAALTAAGQQALTALDQCILSGKEQVLCITDIQELGAQAWPLDDRELRQLINGMKAGEAAQAEKALAALTDPCRGMRGSPKAYQTYLLELVMSFVRVASELSLEREDLDQELNRVMQSFFHAPPPLREAREELLRLTRLMMGAIQSQKTSSSLRLAAAAQRYLQENFAQENLSLEELCLHLHISPSYFSMIFKKETKKTFHQYVTELRMDKALTLLSSTELKTAQIAQRVGLPDPSYFSYCFKKHFGFPPSQARRPKEAP